MSIKEEFWLFGYGSLIWKPPPHYAKIEKYPGILQDTCEGSGNEDHRGTPEAPGRVVTLIERSFWETLDDQHAVNNEKVWGMAYRIAPSKVEEVQSYLDIREINGYSIHFVPFRPADPAESLVRTMVYIGTPDNAQFVGPQDPQALAEHISQSRGPSGDNKEYLFMLEESLETLSRDSGDEHVRDLAVRVREIEQTRAQTLELSSTVMPPVTKFRSGGSTDEQEEVEKQ